MKQNKGKQTKVEEVAVKFITVSVGNLHFQAKKYSTVFTLGEMILGLPERRDDNR